MLDWNRFFILLLLTTGFAACRSQTSTVSASPDGATHRLEYRVIKAQSPEFEAEIKLYPRLDKTWRVEFDYPYPITEFLGVQIQRSKDRYVITKIEGKAADSSDSTTLRFKAKGDDGGATPPKNATFTVSVPVEVIASDPSANDTVQTQNGTSDQSQRPVGAGICITDDYGLGKQSVAGAQTSYPTQGDLKSLPPLSVQASNSDLKAFVARVYDQFPTFKAIYQTGLGLTREQALAFMYGDMSRESATNHPVTGKLTWYIELETAITPPDNSAHAWGPFQAAVTNFIGGGYDDQILNKTGLPTPNISDFKDPAISTFAGMKRLAEGIVAAADYFGPNKPASLYLLGTLAHHNTGWVNSAEQQVWRDGYGNEVLRLAQAYRVGSNMTNDVIFYTGQAESDICR